MKTPLILLTNDDGSKAEGLLALKEELLTIGTVVVVAPDEERSGVGQGLTVHQPMRVFEISKDHYSLTGTPTDCILFALYKLLKTPPDLVVSGINNGPNLGDDVMYSGTVAAAREASLHQIPAFAFSLVTHRKEPDFAYGANFARCLIQELVPISSGSFFNVNIPEGKPESYQFTRQGSKIVASSVEERQDPRGQKYYWIGRDKSEWLIEGGSDYEALRKGLVSVTPLQRDQTDYNVLKTYVEDIEESLDFKLEISGGSD